MTGLIISSASLTSSANPVSMGGGGWGDRGQERGKEGWVDEGGMMKEGKGKRRGGMKSDVNRTNRIVSLFPN